MEGYHCRGVGGKITGFNNQVFAEIELPRGLYIVFAKATIAHGSPYVESAGVFQALLKIEGDQDEVIGGLMYSRDSHHGRNFESVSLNVAGEISRDLRARLIVNSTVSYGSSTLYCWEPRLSAFRLSDLNIVESSIHEELEPSNYPRNYLETLVDLRARMGVDFGTLIRRTD